MILHLDMDAFFASVEQMDDPSLRGKPLIIGGGDRGVVATASYEARVYGIHSAMPIAIARKLCPHGVFMRGHGARYSEISKKIMACLHNFSPLVQQASIDEAYMDATGLERLFGSPENLARAVKKRVAEASGGLGCSIGIAPVKFLAKICSDQNKPNGIFILRPHEADEFLLSLKVDKLPGVGSAMSASLRAFGISTVAQLRSLSREFLGQKYGKWGLALHDRAHGLDPRSVHENPPAKSESAELTFQKDVFDGDILEAALWEHAVRLGRRLRNHGEAGRLITLKIKFSNFRTITRSRSLEFKTNSTQAIFDAAKALLKAQKLPLPIRLIGLGVSGFGESPEQLFLPGMDKFAKYHSKLGNVAAGPYPEEENRRLRLDMAMDAIKARFGENSIHTGRQKVADKENSTPVARK